MIFKRHFPVLLGLCILLNSCSSLEWARPDSATTPPAVAGSFQTPTETATIVWFPATDTPTPQPYETHTSTPEMHPGVGTTLLLDAFTEEDLWDTAVSDNGSSSIDRGRLTLAVQPEVYLFSLRHKLNLDDFYAEVTARPNLCRGNDDYGMLVRANAVAYYRFALSCNGTVRAERISVGTRQVLQEPIPSGDAPRGSPGEVRIGVWASGPEMRLFLNDRYQFTIRSPNYRNGMIGVFARSAGDTPVTINFFDLLVQEVDYSPPTSTPAP